MKTIVLLLAANPKETGALRLGEEFRSIKESIQLGNYRDNFKIIQEEAVRAKDLRRLILREKPNIIHFSGHSTTEGIYLENDHGTIQLVSGEALTGLLGLCSDLQCVILNSCYSEAQTQALITVAHYIIGMKQSVKDGSAIKFSIGFYDALGEGRDIMEAFEYGKNAIELEKTTTNLKTRSLDIEFINQSQSLLDLPIILSNNSHINTPKSKKNNRPFYTLLFAIITTITLPPAILFIVKYTEQETTNPPALQDQQFIIQGIITVKGTATKLSNVELEVFGKKDKIRDLITGSDGFYHIEISGDELPSDKIVRIIARKEGFQTITKHYSPGISNFTMTEETRDADQ